MYARTHMYEWPCLGMYESACEYMCTCTSLYVHMYVGVWGYRYMCTRGIAPLFTCGSQRSILGVIPWAPSSLSFESRSLFQELRTDDRPCYNVTFSVLNSDPKYCLLFPEAVSDKYSSWPILKSLYTEDGSFDLE